MYSLYNFEQFLGLMVFPVILFGILISCVLLAFVIWMLVDCINRDEKEFKDKTLWLVLLTVGIFCGYSTILSIIYYIVVKRKLDQ